MKIIACVGQKLPLQYGGYDPIWLKFHN